ncbi:organic cation transporter protein-like [Branchiostoma lanceolatum]|uniref:organic cation transporter protein-like n=1 Tax=Branchiostoma lanceolatum TaxID=7740 RepID=UPI003453C9FA
MRFSLRETSILCDGPSCCDVAMKVTERHLNMADFDEVLKHIGELGPYQIRLCFLVYLPALPCCMHMFSMVFIGATPLHHCATPELDAALSEQNASLAERMNVTIPWELADGVWHHSSCTRYNMSEYSLDLTNATAGPTFNMAANLSTTECDAGWEYDRSQFHTSVSVEFDLVCSRKWLNNLAQSILMVGVLCGAVVFGDLSDRYGRKWTFFLALSLQVLFGVANAFTHSYATFVFLRFLVGACAYPVFMIAFVIGQEIVGPSKRALAGSVIELAFGAAIMVLAGLAYAIREWTFLQLAITLPSAVFILSWWLVPESQRWLVAKGRLEEAMEIIQLMAKRNGKALPSDIRLDRTQRSNRGQHSALDLVRTPNMMRKSIVIFSNWFAVTILYYGLSLSTADLAGDDYVNFFLVGVVEVPGYLSSFVVIDRLGRRVPHMLYMVVGGVACVAAAFIPKHLAPLTTTLVMIGKFGAAGAFNIIYIWTGELYPTVVRNVGVGVSVLWSRCGGIASPFIALLKDVWGPFPLIILGAPACLAGALALVLPETLGLPLPETMEEAEHFGGRRRTNEQYMPGSDAESHFEMLETQ